MRRGLTSAPLDRFQEETGAQISVLRRVRDRALGRASRIVVPSRAFAEIVAGWGFEAEVVPHAVSASSLPDVSPNGRTLVFAGRLVPQKALSVAFEAVRRNEDVTLLVAGDGPERTKIEAGAPANVRFLGAQPRERVFELMRGADATLLSSDWESFGLVVAESLAVGTPVLAASAGGVGEVLEDGRNGLLVPAGDIDGLAAAIGRFFAEDGLRTRLAAAAPASVERYAPERVYGRLEEILLRAAG